MTADARGYYLPSLRDFDHPVPDANLKCPPLSTHQNVGNSKLLSSAFPNVGQASAVMTLCDVTGPSARGQWATHAPRHGQAELVRAAEVASTLIESRVSEH